MHAAIGIFFVYKRTTCFYFCIINATWDTLPLTGGLFFLVFSRLLGRRSLSATKRKRLIGLSFEQADCRAVSGILYIQYIKGNCCGRNSGDGVVLRDIHQLEAVVHKDKWMGDGILQAGTPVISPSHGAQKLATKVRSLAPPSRIMTSVRYILLGEWFYSVQVFEILVWA